MSLFTASANPSRGAEIDGNYTNLSTAQVLPPMPSLPPLGVYSRAVSTESACSDYSAASVLGQPKLFVEHNYQDHSQDPVYHDTSTAVSSDGKRRGPRGGVLVPFPEKLYLMLAGVQKDGLEDVVSWQPHGRCFAVHQPQRFVEEVMPRYFSQTKLTSFQRQVNLYGFRRLTTGADRTGYYHEYFLRGRPDLLKKISRIRVKGIGCKLAPSPETEPNFYKFSTCHEKGDNSLSCFSGAETTEDPTRHLLNSLLEAPSAEQSLGSTSKRSSMNKKMTKKQNQTDSTGFQFLAQKTEEYTLHESVPPALNTLRTSLVDQLKQSSGFFDTNDSFKGEQQEALSSLQLRQFPDVKNSSVGRFLMSSHPTGAPASCEEDLILEPIPYNSFTPNPKTSILDFQDDIISLLGDNSSTNSQPTLASFSNDDTALFDLCFANVQYNNAAAY